jgi:hypothetical protein
MPRHHFWFAVALVVRVLVFAGLLAFLLTPRPVAPPPPAAGPQVVEPVAVQQQPQPQTEPPEPPAPLELPPPARIPTLRGRPWPHGDGEDGGELPPRPGGPRVDFS